DEFIVDLHQAVFGVRVGAHDIGPAAGVQGGLFLPDDGAQVIEADALALTDELGVQRDDLIPAINRGAGELIADVEAQPAAGPEDPETFAPGMKQVGEVLMQALAMANLPGYPVILDLPVRGGGDHQVDAVPLDL